MTSERVIAENAEDRLPWQFIPNFDTERLQFQKIEEEEPEYQREGLGKVNLA